MKIRIGSLTSLQVKGFKSFDNSKCTIFNILRRAQEMWTLWRSKRMQPKNDGQGFWDQYEWTYTKTLFHKRCGGRNKTQAHTKLLFQRHKMKRRKAALVAMIAEEESSNPEQREMQKCNINRTDILGHKETFMIFLCFCLQKESFLHITYILCISVAENNEIDGENPFWVIIDVGGDRFQARRWSFF